MRSVEAGGRYYHLTRASDPDGMALELDDVAPDPGRGMIAMAYRHDGGHMSVRWFSCEPLPIRLVEEFLEAACLLLPPARPC
jgi:hypothetical protein